MLVVLALVTPVLEAHLAGEEEVVKGFEVELGVNPEHPSAGERVSFSVAWENPANESVVAPEKAWVRITKNEEVFFAGFMKPEPWVAFTYKFLEGGVYKLAVKAYIEGEEVSFTHEVEVAEGEPSQSLGGGANSLAAFLFASLAIAARLAYEFLSPL